MSLSHEVGREDNHSVSTVLPQDPNQVPLLAVTWELLGVGSSIFPLQGYWSSCPNLGSSLLVSPLGGPEYKEERRLLKGAINICSLG